MGSMEETEHLDRREQMALMEFKVPLVRKALLV
jgi:hypothetical protein